MHRRQVLAAGAGTLAGLAGCLGVVETPGSAAGDGNRPPPDDTSDGLDPSTHSIAPCPPVETDRERAVCSHTVDTATEPVYLTATPERRSLDGGTPADPVSLTLHNQSATALTFNPHSWRLWHRQESRWTALDPQLSGDGTLTVPPGETHSWSLVDAVASIRPDPTLEPGLYAVELGVPDPGGGAWLACLAFLQLD